MSIRSTKQTQAPAKTTTKQKAGVATNYIFLLLIPVGKTLVAFKMRGEYEESAVDATLTSNVNTLRRNWRIFTLYPEEAYAAGEGRKLLHKRALDQRFLRAANATDNYRSAEIRRSLDFILNSVSWLPVSPLPNRQ